MSPKYALQYILEKLKDRAELALKDPKLIEIAKTAPLNTKNEPNLTWVYNQAFKYAVGQTTDLKKSKELALSTRFLAMIRRDYPAEFEKLIAEKSAKPKPEEPKKEIPEPPEKKRFEEIEFEIPDTAEIIERERLQCHSSTKVYGLKKRFIKFPEAFIYHRDTWTFCWNILNAMVAESRNGLVNYNALIEILEKRGLKIKVCGNCFYKNSQSFSNQITCEQLYPDIPKIFSQSCGFWKAEIKN